MNSNTHESANKEDIFNYMQGDDSLSIRENPSSIILLKKNFRF